MRTQETQKRILITLDQQRNEISKLNNPLINYTDQV